MCVCEKKADSIEQEWETNLRHFRHSYIYSVINHKCNSNQEKI